jgi:Uma2 family endonuclease
MIPQRINTLEEFEAFIARPENADKLFEFVNGEIIEKLPGRTYNSGIGLLIAVAVHPFCKAHNLPCHMSSGDGAYRVGSDVVAPDFAYKQTPLSDQYPDPAAPLWAVEVISPTDKPRDIRDKRAVYVKAGILLWEVYPQLESVYVYQPGKPLVIRSIDDTLDGGDVLPGFTLAVKEIFPE